MKTWNIHAWYVTGILLVLLIGTLSVKWASITNLADIISFALGLSSLILAIIAIVQSLTGGAEISRALGDVRAASTDLKADSNELKLLASDVSGVGTRMAESHDELVKIINSQSNTSVRTADKSKDAPKGELDLRLLPLGGAEAIYAAAWSAQTGHYFFMGEFRENEDEWVNMAFDDGFLSALVRFGIIEGTFDGAKVKIENLGMDPAYAREKIRAFHYNKEVQKSFEARLTRIDVYFRGLAAPEAASKN